MQNNLYKKVELNKSILLCYLSTTVVTAQRNICENW